MNELNMRIERPQLNEKGKFVSHFFKKCFSNVFCPTNGKKSEYGSVREMIVAMKQKITFCVLKSIPKNVSLFSGIIATNFYLKIFKYVYIYMYFNQKLNN